jgi:hypothetical protein
MARSEEPLDPVKTLDFTVPLTLLAFANEVTEGGISCCIA